ncbi:IS66 family insertion sequence element accessory protein TnpA [Brevibacillus panacihumi]|uniref:IS66 family insertion sequence element accessory protein TnpA n=1 Tax=Brevibacillus panacihumi TaxID=497735 RepID=UPI000A0043D5
MDTREVTTQYRFNQWTEIVRKCRSSGQTVAVWCAENNIKPSSYYYWLRRIRKAACEALPSLSGNNPIVPVHIPNHAVETCSSDQESSDIVLRFGAVTLEIRNHASATLIENTLRALQHVR